MALGFMNINVCDKNGTLAKLRGEGDFTRLTVRRASADGGGVDVAGKSANITCDAASYDALLVGRTISIAYDDGTFAVTSVSVQMSSLQPRSNTFTTPPSDDRESLAALDARLTELTQLVRDEFAALNVRLDELREELRPGLPPLHRLASVDAAGDNGATDGPV